MELDRPRRAGWHGGDGDPRGTRPDVPRASRGFPLTVFAINLVGSFALGLLLETLVRRGPDEGARRTARLLLGTGLIGGFTTYSAFAVDVAALTDGAPAVAIGYAVGSVVLGAVAAGAGIVAGARLHGRRSRRGASDRPGGAS
nr:hypothetical protein GCM10025699_64650 [Microbacterium flavescens]